MSIFWQEILGKDNNPAILGAAFVFALIGHFLVLVGGTQFRDPKSGESPHDFSWKYLLRDNAKRISYVLLLIVVSLRFMPDLFNFQVTAWGGFLVGVGLDGIALVIKQKTKILDPKS
jgi:hypothetical protein